MTPYEEQKLKAKELYKKQKEERIAKGECVRCGKPHSGPTITCLECNMAKLNNNVKWRNMTFQILGDKCMDCGTTDRRVFTIDHPDGDGKYHRKNSKVNWKQYYLAAQTGDIFLEIRCYNCHAIKDLKRTL